MRNVTQCLNCEYNGRGIAYDVANLISALK